MFAGRGGERSVFAGLQAFVSKGFSGLRAAGREIRFGLLGLDCSSALSSRCNHSTESFRLLSASCARSALPPGMSTGKKTLVREDPGWARTDELLV